MHGRRAPLSCPEPTAGLAAGANPWREEENWQWDALSELRQVPGLVRAGPLDFFPGWLSPQGHMALVLWGLLGLGSSGKCFGESPTFGSAWTCPRGSCSRLSCQSGLCLILAEGGQEMERWDRGTWSCSPDILHPASRVLGWESLSSVGGI